MKFREIKWFVVIQTLAALFVFWGARAEAQSQSGERRQFLFNLGFEDYSKQIREALDKGAFEHELNRRQMNRNALMYESINASRELSIFIWHALDSQNLNEQKLEVLSQFTAKMLALKPLAPETDFPIEIMELAESERDIELAKWLDKQRRQQMETHTRKIVADIGFLLAEPGKELSSQELSKVYKLASVIVERTYLDELIGNTRFFGRSLLALLAREEKIGRLVAKDTLARVGALLKKSYGLRVENFIGDTMVMDGKDGDKLVKIKDGTQMLTKNLSAESLTISIAAIPKNLILRWKARFKGLVGNPLSSPFYVSAHDVASGITLNHRVRDIVSQSDTMIETGLSHIVYYQIKEDPRTGIKMPRVIHNYPSAVADASEKTANTGGVIITYPEQVIDRSHHSQVYFAHFNEERFKTEAQKYIAAHGYSPEFFKDTIQLELSEDGTPTKSENTVSKPWKTKISENDFRDLHAENDAKVWSEKVLKRFTKTLENFSLRGVTFHWPDPYDFYILDSAYCSQTGEMAMQEAVNLPLEMQKSSWHWGLKALAKIGALGEYLEKSQRWSALGKKLKSLPGVEKSLKITQIRIMAPSNLVIQKYMDGERIPLRSLNLEQRFSTSYGSYREFNEMRVRQLENILPRSNPEFKVLETKFIDPVRSFAASVRDIEYSFVMRASRGLTTHIVWVINISIDIITVFYNVSVCFNK